MADISDAVDPIAAAIYAHYEKKGEAEKQRTYVGASVIGRPCARSLWYAFRWVDKERFDGRMLRLFDTGHRAEPRFVADLRNIGVTVYEVDPQSGKQFGFSDHGGHAKGHMDGAAMNVPGGGKKWHVLEFKTHSAKSFAALKRDGVRKAKPEHFEQMNWYMGQSGMDRALYLAVNKDDESLYSERVEFDPVAYEQVQVKFQAVIFSPLPPRRISDDPKYYLCNWCPFNAVCHQHKGVQKTCRTCIHATPEREGDGRWSCAKHGPEIPVEGQRTGCADHLVLPFLVTYAEADDAGEGWIKFTRRDNGKQFVVTTEANLPPGPLPADEIVYSSAEICAAEDHRIICDQVTQSIRQKFEGRIVG